MIVEEVRLCIKVAACICAKDGVISQAEEESLLASIKEKYPSITVSEFECVITEFLDSTIHIEEYIGKISDRELQNYALEIARTSASADGLDIRENRAYQKACAICGVIANG